MLNLMVRTIAPGPVVNKHENEMLCRYIGTIEQNFMASVKVCVIVLS
jgi:hypothetical protein